MDEYVDHGEKLVVDKLGGTYALAWVQAVYLYDHGDPSMVALLIERDHAAMLLSDNVKAFLSSVVTGKRRSVRPANYKGDAEERLNGLLRLHYLNAVISEMQSGGVAGALAEMWAIEPNEVKSLMATTRKSVMCDMSASTGVGAATLETNLKDLRKRLRKYPEL